MKTSIKTSLFAFGLLVAGVTSSASAGVVTNNTDIVTGDDHAQLAQWYGADFDLKRVFAKGINGENGDDWRQVVNAAMDTQETKGLFTIWEAFNSKGERRVLGGFSDFKWLGNGAFLHSENAFIFNLTDGFKLDIMKSNLAGTGDSSSGATFGVDLVVMNSLDSGNNSSLGKNMFTSYDNPDVDLSQFSGDEATWTIGHYESFLLEDSTGDFGTGATPTQSEESDQKATDVPAPSVIAGLSMVLLGVSRKKKKTEA